MPNSTGVADIQIATPRHLISDVSDKLVRARSTATTLPSFPGPIPRDTQTAYAIQTHSISSWYDDIGGWKVGGINSNFRGQFAAERLAGPIFKSQIKRLTCDSDVTMTVFDEGFAAIEAEFIVKTAKRIDPASFNPCNSCLEDFVASVHVGAEIASSPMADINTIGPGAIISDFGNNAGLVIGPEIPRWQARYHDPIDITVDVDGDTVGLITRSIGDDALRAFAFLIDLLLSRGLVMPAGTFVTCGALSGIHDVRPGAKSNVVFGGLAEFSVSFAKRYPSA